VAGYSRFCPSDRYKDFRNQRVESAVKFSFLIQAVVFVLLLFCFGSTENISVVVCRTWGFTECSGDACKRRKDAGKP